MRPNTSVQRNLESLLSLREAFVLIRDFLLASPLPDDKESARVLAAWITNFDRRYGHIEAWHRSSAGSGEPDGAE